MGKSTLYVVAAIFSFLYYCVLYHDWVKSSLFDCVKASGLDDRKLTCIDLILANLRSSNPEALTQSKRLLFTQSWYNHILHLGLAFEGKNVLVRGAFPFSG